MNDFFEDMFVEEYSQLELNNDFEELYPALNEESESLYTTEDEDDQREVKGEILDENIIGKKEISFTGMYKCTCGCTHFVDIGHNMCRCGHSYYNHKFWKD